MKRFIALIILLLVTGSAQSEELVSNGIEEYAGIAGVELIEPTILPLHTSSGDSSELRFIWRTPQPETLFGEACLLYNSTPVVTTLTGRGRNTVSEDIPGEILWQYTPEEDDTSTITAIIPFGDADGDGVTDLFVTRDNGHHFCISGSSSGEATVLWEMETIHDGSVGVPRDRRAIASAGDVNRDGNGDIAMGLGGEGRGLWMINGADGEVIWELEFPDGLLGDVNQIALDHLYYTPDLLLVAVDSTLFGVGLRAPCIEWSRSYDYSITSVIREAAYYRIETGTIWEYGYLSAIGFYSEGYDHIGLFMGWNDGGPILSTAYVNGDLLDMVRIRDSSLLRLLALDSSGWLRAFEVDALHMTFDMDNSQIWDTGMVGRRVYELRSTGQIRSLACLWSDLNTFSVYHIDTGELFWQRELEGTVQIAETILDLNSDYREDIMVGLEEGRTLIISGETGEDLFEFAMTGAVSLLASLPDVDNSGGPEIVAVDENGVLCCVSGGTVLDIEERNSEVQPQIYTLAPPYPNPFNATLNVQYEIPKPGDISLTLYDLLGRRVVVLEQGYRTPGIYRTVWDGASTTYASGTYFLRMQAPGFEAVRRVQLLK